MENLFNKHLMDEVLLEGLDNLTVKKILSTIEEIKNESPEVSNVKIPNHGILSTINKTNVGVIVVCVDNKGNSIHVQEDIGKGSIQAWAKYHMGRRTIN